ncbi:MAG: glycosyltransferase family A protein [Pseudomonadota bacterium]
MSSSTDSDGPLVSVVMITRDGEATIEAAIQSVVTQQDCRLELLVIDDHSTDRTVKIVSDLAERHPEIRLLACDGSGIVDARNTALNAARGRYLAVLDCDDLAVPGRFAKQATRMDAEERLVLLGSQAIEFGDDQTDRVLLTIGSTDEEVTRALSTTPPFAHSSVMARASAMRSVGGYRKLLQHAEDFDLYLRLSEVGTVGAIFEPLVRYRVHGGQMSVQKRATQLVCGAAALESASCRRDGQEDPVAKNTRPALLAARLLKRLANNKEAADTETLKLIGRTARGLHASGALTKDAARDIRRVATKALFGRNSGRAARLWLRSFRPQP